jgi:hypothetical protein
MCTVWQVQVIGVSITGYMFVYAHKYAYIHLAKRKAPPKRRLCGV